MWLAAGVSGCLSGIGICSKNGGGWESNTMGRLAGGCCCCCCAGLEGVDGPNDDDNGLGAVQSAGLCSTYIFTPWLFCTCCTSNHAESNLCLHVPHTKLAGSAIAQKKL